MILREKLKQQFDLEYTRLNDQQRQAVDRIEGPVMVIAGPGTGKTQILAARIGKILLDTDAAPGNILCLTYTDSGALAMRRRLLQFIGSDAYKVNIYTFHAFCNDIIQENLSLFDKQELDPISELEKIELIQKLIDAFPKDHPLKRYGTDAYYETNNLLTLFSNMKQEGWTPEYIFQCVKEYLDDLPNRSEFIAKRASGEFKKGDVRTDWIEEKRQKMERLAAAVGEFPKYQALMRSINRYDFDDMISWVIKTFEENKGLLLNYQERFLYLLVDEYQDTSGSQNKLVQLLINYWDQPNIFVVGDDDQSIYRFQGANIENMEQFVNSYSEDLFKVVLTHNYRSTQQILDISRTLISKNEERLIRKMEGLSKHLVSSHPKFSLHTNHPEIREYESQRQEMVGITLEIEKLLKDVEPGKIAVIYKENSYGEELAKLFRFRNIPAYSKRSLNLFDVPLAQKVITILKYISAELDTPYGGDEMLFRILHSNFFQTPPIEIAKLSVEVADRQFGERKTSIRRLLNERSKMPKRDLFDTGIHPNLKKAGEVLEQLIADSQNMTLQSLLEKVIITTGMLGLIMQSNDKIWSLQVITALFDFVKEETRRNPDLNLGQFVATMQQMEDRKIRIPIVQIGGTEKGVNLLTAHGSKGLEFEHVFFAGCNASLWEKKRKFGSSYTLPDTIFSSKPLTSDEEELRRLFYVAITRAQTHLYISYPLFDNKGGGLEPTRFIAEILDIHDDHPVQKIRVDPGQMIEFQAQLFTETAAPEIEQIENDFISRILEKFVLSVTALNNYLNCPLEFYFKNLIRIPSPKNEQAAFGSAVHFAIQQFFEKMKEDPKEQFPTKSELIRYFEWHMRRNRECFLKVAFERKMEYGHTILSDYYDEYIHQWNKIVVLERTIRNVVVNGVPIKGKLDKLEFHNKLVTVVDYKTGNPENRFKKLQRPNPKSENGGDYWRQAVFYKILVENYGQNNWTVARTEFDFIEPDKKKNFYKEAVEITAEDIDTVTKQITDTWEKIQDRQFFTGCGKKDCDYCNFVKTNELYTRLHEIEEEDEIPSNV